MLKSDERIRARLQYLETEAKDHPTRHALRLGASTLLGYAYPLLVLAITVAISLGLVALGPAAFRTAEGGVIIFWAIGLVLSLLLVLGVLKAFSAKLPAPDGYPLRDGEAPALRELIDQVRAEARDIPIHHIYIDFNLNAAAAQRRRHGLWGSRVNYLLLGVPLLMVTRRDELKSVIAHELAHLHGEHSAFSAWVYRVFRTWDSLSGALRDHKMRFLLVGWFLRWYGGHYAITTLPLRRVHEYAADRSAAGCIGADVTADALVRIGWSAYRLERQFWPELFSEAGHEPLPPKSLLDRVEVFLRSDPDPEMIERWRSRELRTRTPIDSSHPCLLDRLVSLERRPALDDARVEELGPFDEEADSWRSLLGNSAERIATICNASWKAMVIERWRMEHGQARYLRDQIKEHEKKNPGAELTLERQWEMAELDARFVSPTQSLERLQEFAARFPDHAPSQFAIGSLLLNQDDESGVMHLEAAGKCDSDYLGSVLQRLLEYYREAGRDAEAEPIRQRLDEHEQALSRAQQERLKVRRGDRFLPHGLPAEDVEKLRRVLYRFPQIKAAYLVRKEKSVFVDKRTYVLALHRSAPTLEDHSGADKALIEGLQSSIAIPCAAVILKWTTPRLASRIRRACPVPIFTSPD